MSRSRRRPSQSANSISLGVQLHVELGSAYTGCDCTHDDGCFLAHLLLLADVFYIVAGGVEILELFEDVLNLVDSKKECKGRKKSRTDSKQTAACTYITQTSRAPSSFTPLEWPLPPFTTRNHKVIIVTKCDRQHFPCTS